MSFSDGMKKRTFILFFSLIAMFLFIRIYNLFFYQGVFHEGELYRGTIGKEILEGRSWPFMLYQNDPHEGGSLIIGTVVSVFFFFFGQSLLVLKSVSLIFALLSFIVIFAFIHRYYNLNTAVLTSLITILSPPIFIVYSVITMGKYYELVLLEYLAIFLFFKIFFIQDTSNLLRKKEIFSSQDYSLIFILGLLNGIGTYFSYAYIILLLTFVIAWFINDRAFFLKKYFVIHLCSFLIGFSPWIIYNLNYGFQGLSIRQKSIGWYFNLHLFIDRIRYFLFDYMPGAFNVEVRWHAFGYIFVIMFISSLVFLVFINRKQLLRIASFRWEKLEMPGKATLNIDIFLLIYTAIFILIYGMSNFKSSPFEDYTQYKYLFTFMPFIFIIFGLVLNKMLNTKISFVKWLTLPSIIFIILPGVLFINFISHNSLNEFLFLYKPYSYELMGCNVVKFEKDPFRRLNFINRIKEEHRAYAYKGFGNALAEDFVSKPDWYRNNFFDRIDKRFRPFFYEGICIGLSERCQKSFSAVYSLILAKINPENRPYCYEGLGIFNAIKRDEAVQLIKQFDASKLRYFYKGVGVGIMEFNHYNMDKSKEYISNVDAEYQPFCWNGVRESVIFKEYRPREDVLNKNYDFP